MSQDLIRAILEGKVQAWADSNDLPAQFENQDFTKPAGEYVQTFLLPGRNSSADLAGKHTAYVGVFQINLFTALRNGPSAGEQYVKQLAAIFATNAQLSDTTIDPTLTVVVMTPVSAGTGFPDAGHWGVPASFSYRADVVSP